VNVQQREQPVGQDLAPARVALVTGAGSGLGRHLALALAEDGAAVAAIDLNEDGLFALAADLRGKPFAWSVGDVCDLKGLRAAVAELEGRLGPIDLLFANAGIGRATSVLAFNAEDIEAVVRVNLLGVANSIDAVLPGMVQRRRGHLVGISSLASFRGLPMMAGYCASKAGVNALLDSLRVELRPYGVTVTTVCPGWIRTPLTANLGVPLPNILEPADAARRILRAVRRRRPFLAFPGSSARRLRLLRWLPCAASDWLTFRVLKSLSKK